MGAHGADVGGLRAHDDVAAVAAFPHLDLALFEHLRGLHVVQQRAVALLVVLFDGANLAELLGQLREALFLGRLAFLLRHRREIRVLVRGLRLAGKRRLQVLLGLRSCVLAHEKPLSLYVGPPRTSRSVPRFPSLDGTSQRATGQPSPRKRNASVAHRATKCEDEDAGRRAHGPATCTQQGAPVNHPSAFAAPVNAHEERATSGIGAALRVRLCRWQSRD